MNHNNHNYNILFQRILKYRRKGHTQQKTKPTQNVILYISESLPGM